jgi:hypothetical protein
MVSTPDGPTAGGGSTEGSIGALGWSTMPFCLWLTAFVIGADDVAGPAQRVWGV